METQLMTREVTVCDPDGLHMRPAQRLVRLASRYSAQIHLGRGGDMMDCESILSLLTLGAVQGDRLQLAADGEDAAAAVDEITAWFAAGFPEDEASVP